MVKATAGLKGVDKLDAVLRFIVEYQHSYSGVRMVDVEPEHTIAQFSRVIPQMRDGLQRHLPGPNAAVKAATVIRIAISHYIVRSDDADQFLAQLRHAVGIKARRSPGLVEQHRGVEVAGRVQRGLDRPHRSDIGGLP